MWCVAFIRESKSSARLIILCLATEISGEIEWAYLFLQVFDLNVMVLL